MSPWMHHNLSLQSLKDEHVGCFQIPCPLTNSVVVNEYHCTCVSVCLWNRYIDYIPGSGVTKSKNTYN